MGGIGTTTMTTVETSWIHFKLQAVAYMATLSNRDLPDCTVQGIFLLFNAIFT